METIYGLTWDSSDPNTDTYGSQIAYNRAGFVRYQNELQPAGKKIHWWETKIPAGDAQGPHYGSKVLPQLPRQEKFHLLLDGTITPDESVGIMLLTYDQHHQLVNETMSLSKQLTFELTDEEVDYEISLVKFNNEHLEFRALFIIPDQIWKTFTIQPRFDMAAIDLVPKRTDAVATTGTVIVRSFNRVVDATPLSGYEALEPHRIIWITADWDATDLAQKLTDFKTEFHLRSVQLIGGDLISQKLLVDVERSDN
ncbi:accessory Sec system protein Asp3 [Fructilactobacillus myrtifloralis]|uniref:Accessory Sec system protein Asp3 n=1 Tax=Fructilactobacillus myrtifloralis TaxID=2940301 RepID=A0ABY5BN29_9LACO|nr:accessory Sec system protein Asp3 [Fructilactobacillus myrtifloralis]USS84995.1 accessory Sec system protein Asp3 [Fructilactobacillus myrtifloralis]